MYRAEASVVQRVPGIARLLLTSNLPGFGKAGRIENADYGPAYSHRISESRVIPPELGNSALQLARNSRLSNLGIQTVASRRQVTANEKVSCFNRFMETCGTVATAALTGVSGAPLHISQLEMLHSSTVTIHSWNRLRGWRGPGRNNASNVDPSL